MLSLVGHSTVYPEETRAGEHWPVLDSDEWIGMLATLVGHDVPYGISEEWHKVCDRCRERRFPLIRRSKSGPSHLEASRGSGGCIAVSAAGRTACGCSPRHSAGGRDFLRLEVRARSEPRPDERLREHE